jgi:hypothetical protein
MSSWSKKAKIVQGWLPITAPFFPLPEKFWDNTDSRTDDATESDWADTIDNQTSLVELISPLQQLDLTEIDATDIIHYGPFFSESASPLLTWRDFTISMDYPREFYLGRTTFLVELCNFEVLGTFKNEPTTFLTFFLLLDAAVEDEQVFLTHIEELGLRMRDVRRKTLAIPRYH